MKARPERKEKHSRNIQEKKHSTGHIILQLIDQVNNSFERNQFSLGIFIDLSKAFDSVDNKVLISKLKDYGVKENIQQ